MTPGPPIQPFSQCVQARMEDRDRGFYERLGKRALDVALTLPIAVVAVPIVAVSALMIKAESKGPAFFTQTRVGLGVDEFTIYKVRTMTYGNTARGQVFGNGSGVTRVGDVLRRLKVDELPQLWNVLKGDMSLVGPRPCLPDTAGKAIRNGNGWQRFLVRPGLTGLAQINGNIYLSWPERWAFDQQYVNTLSLRGDFSILVRTVRIVRGGEMQGLKGDRK